MSAAALLIRGAEVIDGTGAPRFAADVRVCNGRIDGLLPSGSPIEAGERVLDAGGLVLCPGFIDTHSHDDLLVLQPTQPHPKLAQGVCSVVTGNCGISLAPMGSARPPPLDLLGEGFEYAHFRDYLSALDRSRPCINVMPLIGHTSLRVKHVADLQRAANATEVDAMRGEVLDALEAGAFGMSTGVYYPPARAASTGELLAVCSALKGRDAMLAMHIRDEGAQIDAAVQEALQVGAASEARLVLSHHKVVGAPNHGRTRQTLRAVDVAAENQSVCLDCYPYEASSTMLDAERAARVENVLITWSAPHPEVTGTSLRSIADAWGLSLFEAAQRLLPGGAIYFAMAAEDVERVLSHPLTMIGSDGLPHDKHPHPRLWGSFPRVLGHYSRDRGLMPLETAVHKMSGLPARRFGLVGRGTVAPGHAADLVLFDPVQISDRASYTEPQALPAGIHSVIVNGAIALHKGEYLDTHAGQRLLPVRHAVR